MAAVLHPPRSPIDAVETYLGALVDRNLAAIPFHPEVRFADPLLPAPLVGKAAACAFLEPLLPALHAIDIERHVVDGSMVATQWVAETVWGHIPIFELFRVVDGLIVEMEAYFDPRPIVAGSPGNG
jgi:limonene-1,2-epoxide hydrolase